MLHKFASLNFQIKDNSDVYLPAASSGAFYGGGIFTTIAVYGGQPFLWEKHWKRLFANAARLKIDLSEFSEEEVKSAIHTLITENAFRKGRLRVTFFDETSKGIWAANRQRKTSLLIVSADFNPFSEDLRIMLSPFPVNSRSPLVNLKSSNYLENLFAFEDAQAQGFDEAVRLNEKGKLVSATMANLFWVKNETIFTPALSSGALQGTTRSFVLDNFRVTEVIGILDDLNVADEVFITSAGKGIAKVSEFMNKKFEEAVITRKIQKFFSEFTSGN